jgi:16S rRNA (adenine1518-N6/adenine1519-N6)-dimethyltransferase
LQAPHTLRKRFSQNFLEDRGIVRQIIAAIDPRRDDRIVEIGPGPAHSLRRCLSMSPIST